FCPVVCGDCKLGPGRCQFGRLFKLCTAICYEIWRWKKSIRRAITRNLPASRSARVSFSPASKIDPGRCNFDFGRFTMGKIRLTLACWDYDRTRALQDGRV